MRQSKPECPAQVSDTCWYDGRYLRGKTHCGQSQYHRQQSGAMPARLRQGCQMGHGGEFDQLSEWEFRFISMTSHESDGSLSISFLDRLKYL